MAQACLCLLMPSDRFTVNSVTVLMSMDTGYPNCALHAERHPYSYCTFWELFCMARDTDIAHCGKYRQSDCL